MSSYPYFFQLYKNDPCRCNDQHKTHHTLSGILYDELICDEVNAIKIVILHHLSEEIVPVKIIVS